MIRSFEDYAKNFPSRRAIIDVDGTGFTFADVSAKANRISHLLDRSGYKRGDVVCTLLRNGADMLIIQRGILRLPVYLSTINWHLTPPEIAYILEDSKVRLFFTSLEFLEIAEEAMRLAGIDESALVIVDAPPADPRSLHARLEGLPTSAPKSTTSGMRRLYTSGTTGRPKAVRRPLSDRTPELAAEANLERAELYGVNHEEGVYLNTAPMYHAAPLAYADQALDLGHTVVILEKWDAQSALNLIERHQVTWSYMVPLMFQDLLALPASLRPAPKSLRGLVHTAAPCPPHVKRAMIDWVGPILTEIYGGTEGSATVIRSSEWLEHPGSVGKARPGARIEIRDDDGKLLGSNQIGNIYFENLAASFIYDNDEEKTASSRIDNSITLGDIGYLDNEGYLYLCDRKADTVISGGVNIYPAEIEHALKEIAWVRDACVIGVPDDRWGEALHAVVVIGEDAPKVEVRNDILDRELRQRVAGFKVPRSFEYSETLPYSEAGKLLRREVRRTRTPEEVRANASD